MNILTIPVIIEQIDTHHLRLRPLNNIEDCPQCARGEGCGARPWFRGLFKNRTALTLPHDNQTWQDGEHAELHLPARILTILTALTYATPLFFFISTLFVAQQLPEILQLPLAIFMAIAAYYPAYRYGERLIHRHLRLYPASSAAIVRCA